MLLGPAYDQRMKVDEPENIDNQSEHIKQMEVIANDKKSLYSSTIDDLMQTIPTEENNAPSPSEILRNLCLSSDQDNLPHDNRDILHDFLKEFEFL